MPAKLWPSDYELERQITLLHDRYNREVTPFVFKLFQNDFTIDAEWEEADLVEATFDGYEPFELFDEWEVPIKVEPGIWSMRTSLHTWDPPAVGDPQLIYGAWVTDQTDGVIAANLVEPWEMIVAGDPLRLRFIYRHLAAALLEQIT